MSEIYKSLLDPKGKFGFWGIIVLVALGLALLVVPGQFIGKEKPTPEQKTALPQASVEVSSLSSLEASLARQVSEILQQVEGAGGVSVSVTLEAGCEQDFAKNTTSDSSTIQENDNAGGNRMTTTVNQRTEVVFAQNGSQPLVVKEKGPQIKGVLVVAEGAADSEVKLKLSHAVQAMLKVPAHRIMVLTKESR